MYNILFNVFVATAIVSFCGVMLFKRGLCHHVVSICVSVTFVHSVKMNRYLPNFFTIG